MSSTAQCPECGTPTGSATNSAGRLCPQCGASLSIASEVYDAEIISLDAASNVDPDTDSAMLIKDDDLVDDIAESPVASPNASDPMAFLKSLEPAVPEGRRRCPHCRELILQNAIKCRHCLTLLDSKEVQRPPMSALMRDLTIAERLMMQSYRAGMRRLMAFSALMTILGIGYTLYYASLPGTTLDGEARFHFFGGFALGWFGCAYYCGKYEIDGAYVVGGLCVFDMLWTIATLNPLGVLVCGPMLWVVIRTVGHGRDLRRRGLDLRLPW